MRRYRALAVAFSFLAIAATASRRCAAAPGAAGPRQRHKRRASGRATRSSSRSTSTASTPPDLHRGDGTFTLPPLPAGIYKIIAVKQGFLPAIATIVPTNASTRVNLALTNEKNRPEERESGDLGDPRLAPARHPARDRSGARSRRSGTAAPY